MAGINDDDFDDTAKNGRRKMLVSDAIEQADGGKKPGKKGKKRKNAKNNAADNNMLNVQKDDDNQSWDSSRAKAKHIDLRNNSNKMAASPMGGPLGAP